MATFAGEQIGCHRLARSMMTGSITPHFLGRASFDLIRSRARVAGEKQPARCGCGFGPSRLNACGSAALPFRWVATLVACSDGPEARESLWKVKEERLARGRHRLRLSSALFCSIPSGASTATAACVRLSLPEECASLGSSLKASLFLSVICLGG